METAQIRAVCFVGLLKISIKLSWSCGTMLDSSKARLKWTEDQTDCSSWSQYTVPSHVISLGQPGDQRPHSLNSQRSTQSLLNMFTYITIIGAPLVRKVKHSQDDSTGDTTAMCTMYVCTSLQHSLFNAHAPGNRPQRSFLFYRRPEHSPRHKILGHLLIPKGFTTQNRSIQ